MLKFLFKFLFKILPDYWLYSSSWWWWCYPKKKKKIVNLTKKIFLIITMTPNDVCKWGHVWNELNILLLGVRDSNATSIVDPRLSSQTVKFEYFLFTVDLRTNCFSQFFFHVFFFFLFTKKNKPAPFLLSHEMTEFFFRVSYRVWRVIEYDSKNNKWMQN